MTASRACLLIFSPYEPENLMPKPVAMHSCDNPICVRWDHLSWGSLSDNMIDSVKRGRHFRCSGERYGGAILTESLVREMRRVRETEKISVRAIAERYDLNLRTVVSVIYRQTWKHI